jgi:hypothetical protein
MVANTPAEFAAQIAAEFEVYKKVVAAAEAQARTDAAPSLQTQPPAKPGPVPLPASASRAVVDRFIDALWIEDGLAPLTLAPTGVT